MTFVCQTQLSSRAQKMPAQHLRGLYGKHNTSLTSIWQRPALSSRPQPNPQRGSPHAGSSAPCSCASLSSMTSEPKKTSERTRSAPDCCNYPNSEMCVVRRTLTKSSGKRKRGQSVNVKQWVDTFPHSKWFEPEDSTCARSVTETTRLLSISVSNTVRNATRFRSIPSSIQKYPPSVSCHAPRCPNIISQQSAVDKIQRVATKTRVSKDTPLGDDVCNDSISVECPPPVDACSHRVPKRDNAHQRHTTSVQSSSCAEGSFFSSPICIRTRLETQARRTPEISFTSSVQSLL